MKSGLTDFFHSIRFRLALWFSLVLAVVLTVFGTFIYLRELQAVQSDTTLRLSARLRQFEESILRRPRFESEGGDSPATPPTITFGLQDYEGALLADRQAVVKQTSGVLNDSDASSLARMAASLAPADFSPGQPHERFFAYRLSAVKDGEPTNYVFGIIPLPNNVVGDFFLLGRPVDPDNRMPRLLMTLLLGGSGMLLVAAAGGSWLAGRALRPVQKITHAARLISEEDLHTRLNLNTRDELGELGRTFDGMLDRLQAAFDRQRRFTADASHELRTPLTILTLESERVLEGKRGGDEYRAALQTVRSESRYMAHLVEEMLALARMDAGQARLKREPLDLSDVALDAVERLLPLAERKRIRLETGALPELSVLGDRAALSQLAGNLVDNALKYTPGGAGAWVRVETGERRENGQDWAWLRVSDSGPGIPESSLPHLFERFYRADDARSRNPEDGEDVPGSGLGLSIVQRIAELHGGNVRAFNPSGGGAVFEINLPRA